MDIFSLLNNDISGLSEEERRIAEKFNEDLRKKIIDDLAKCEINEIINELKSDEENFKALCCKMKKGDLLIVCGVDDIGSTRNEIEDTWRQIRDLEVEIRVITAPALLQKENMTLDELLIRDVTLSVLAFQVEIANQKLKEL